MVTENHQGFLQELKKEKKIIRVTFLGDGAVGKTTLVSKFIEKYGDTLSELPKEERTPFMNITAWKQDPITVQCFDLAGQRVEDAHPIDILSDQVIDGLDIIFFVFTLDRYASFENLETWYNLVEKSLKSDKNNVYRILIGNKSDLTQLVDDTLIEQVINNGLFSAFFKTSAVKDEGIAILADKIIEIGRSNLGLN